MNQKELVVQKIKLVEFDPYVKNDFKKYYNSNNHFEYMPFIEKDNEVVFQQDFFQSLSEFVQKQMKEIVSKHKKKFSMTEKVKTPHENNQSLLIYEIYHSYNNWFSYQYFKCGLDFEVELVEMNKDVIETLQKISHIRVITGRKLTDDHIEDLPDKFVKEIETKLNKFKSTGAFVKTSETSAKNDMKMKPAYTVKEVLHGITSSKKILGEYNRHYIRDKTFLVLLPWNKNINENNEFRVIIVDKEIKGISQQVWYKKLEISDKQIVEYFQKINELWNKIRNILPYKDMILDVFVHEGKANLIEVNPGGIAWCSSGSSLFHWVNDIQIFQTPPTTKKIYFRVVE